MNRYVIRGLLFVLVMGLVLTMPWWTSAILLIALTVYFELYFEVIFFGFLIDSLYSPNLTFPYTASTIALFFLLTTSYLRQYVRT